MRRLVVGLLRLAAIIGGGGLAVAFTLAAIAPRLGDIFTANESASAEINLNELALRSIVYDMHGDEFDVLYDVENRELVTLDDISPPMIMSLLVVEDEGFYDTTASTRRRSVERLSRTSMPVASSRVARPSPSS